MPTAAEPFTIQGPGGVQIVADRLGDPRARAVVFLHGGGQTRRSWGKAAAAVAAQGWQAVTVDLRGHGESDWSDDGDYRVVSFAADVLEVLRTLPAQPVLVGASLGGFTSMLLAGSCPPASPVRSCWWISCRTWTSPGPTEYMPSWPTGWSRASAHWTKSPMRSPNTIRTGRDQPIWKV